jgi:hypothetical protein
MSGQWTVGSGQWIVGSSLTTIHGPLFTAIVQPIQITACPFLAFCP